MTTDALIRRHRSADATVTVHGPDGPLANHEVTIAQRSHEAPFRLETAGAWAVDVRFGEPVLRNG